MNAIGHSLMEEMIYRDGQLLNPNLVDYRVPSFNDLPKDFETILVESRQWTRAVRFEGYGRGRFIAGRRGDRQCGLSRDRTSLV